MQKKMISFALILGTKYEFKKVDTDTSDQGIEQNPVRESYIHTLKILCVYLYVDKNLMLRQLLCV